MNVSAQELVQLIGAKEVEIYGLRKRVSELEQRLQFERTAHPVAPEEMPQEGKDYGEPT